MKLSKFILLALIFGLVNQAFAQKKPNIIFILADDYGVGEVGCYGSDFYKTPHIDQLAKTGIRFTNAYTVPLCGPSRALILTGRYGFRTGAINQDKTGEFTTKAETMIPVMLKKAGYVSASIGKWGQLPLSPIDFGFDKQLTFTGSGTYWNTQERGKNYMLDNQKIDLKDKEYLPDLMHAKAVEFMAENKNKPFFLYYSMSHVHNDILPTPDSKPGASDPEIYADNITYMDKLIGKLMKTVDSLQIRENTLVVFMGDNGTANIRASRATIQGKKLVGAKGSMQEGGGLVPLIIHWKKVTPIKISNTMVDASDFFPTFMELAGIKKASNALDGQSLLPEIKGQTADHRTWIFNQLANNFYVRELHWKLNQNGELFDMSKAPFEEILVTSENQEASAAKARLQKILDQLNPSAGFKDYGDGTGRHAKNQNKKN